MEYLVPLVAFAALEWLMCRSQCLLEMLQKIWQLQQEYVSLLSLLICVKSPHLAFQLFT